MSSIGRISLDLSVNKKGFDKQVDGIHKHTSKVFNMMSVAVGNIMANMAQRAVESVGQFVKGSIDKGSEIAELQNVVDSVFTSMADKVDTFAKSALESYGLTEKQAKKMVGTYGAMSKAFGYSEKQAYDMSTSLAALTGDVASFYNLNHDEAYTKLKSVFTGETESLKELGVVMTQAALDQFALENGFGKTTNAMSEQEKVALRLAFVHNKLNVAAGDFTKTQSQWANQTRILAGQFDTFQSILGQGFINVLTPVLNMINKLMAKLIQLANMFKSFTDMISGAKGGGGNAGAVMQDVADAAGSAASSTGGIEDAANGAAKAAKKAQKALMGFDEINKLTKNESGTGGSASGGGAFSSFIPTLPDVKTDGKPILDSIFGNINFDPLKSSFKKLKDAVMPVIDTIADAISWFMENVLAPLGKWTIEDAIPAFFNVLAGVFKVLDPLLQSLAPSLTWLWDNFLSPIASWTGGVIVSTLNLFGDTLDRIGTWMSANQPIIDSITSSVLAFFGAWKLTQLMAFVQMSGGVVAAIKAITAATWSNVAAKIADKAETVYLTALYAKDFLVSIVKGTAALVKQASQWAITTALKIADKVATIASTVATTAMTVATWALNAAIAVLTSPITLVIAAIAALIAGIVLLVKNFDTVKKVATNVFNSIWTIIKKVINSILGGVEAMVNGIAKGINGIVRSLNKLKFNIPDWIPGVGGKSFGLNLKEVGMVSLPRLAEGGYVRANQPQPVIVGDNKRHGEIISPEDKMLAITIKALEQFFGKLKDIGYSANGNGDVGDIIIPIYLDGSLLDEVIVTSQQRRNLRSGGY